MTACRGIATHGIHISGAVQGVGFRPFVYREAVRHGLNGWVKNTGGGVEIIASGETEQLTLFSKALRECAPAAARIDNLIISAIDQTPELTGFHIYTSESAGDKSVAVTTDMATCPACLAEIRDPGNRRHRYPFTNCTACGPRYSIIQSLPYDRERTTMRTFTMCPACQAEYDNPGDRRFHAQPNACPVCGPQLALWDNRGRTLETKDHALQSAVRHIKDGRIVAVKGIGGFHLMTDACNDDAVRTLRARKRRTDKPFAVMMPSLDVAKHYAVISPPEAEWLTGSAAPIVLVKRRSGHSPSHAADTYPPLSLSVAPNNPDIGIFLPYTPLHHLLLEAVGSPLIATSGNLSDEPICIDEEECIERLGGIADYFLVHNRPIAHPVDDSVMRIAAGRPLFIRCARGLAPLSIPMTDTCIEQVTLGTGAHMKSALALGYRDRVVISPHIGDLETVPAWEAYENSFQTLSALYETQPEAAACDLHPDYATTRFTERNFENHEHVQHHHAHVTAVMAEHGLTGPVLGVAWDGTGLGDDGTIWGGEFLRVDTRGFERVDHLRPFGLPGGDIAAREPRRSAFGILRELGLLERAELPFTEKETALLKTAMAKGINTAVTTSMGRLFDAVASIIGICHISSYEGHAAMMLQAKAEERGHDGSSYPIDNREPGNWEPVIRGIIVDQQEGTGAPAIAARFHQSLVAMIEAVSNAHPDLPVVLSGGCFQNTLLLERTVTRLRNINRSVYWPLCLPPNDGAIAFGQVTAASWRKPA